MAPFFLSVFFFHTSTAALYLLSLTSVKQSRIVGTTIFLRRSYTTHMALESSRLAELKHAISAAWDVRKKLTAFDRAIWTKIFRARDGTFFSLLFLPYLSVAPYLKYTPAIPVCSILQPCVSARQKSECRGLLDPRNT